MDIYVNAEQIARIKVKLSNVETNSFYYKTQKSHKVSEWINEQVLQAKYQAMRKRGECLKTAVY